MKKKIFIIVVIILVGFGAIFYLMLSRNTPTTSELDSNKKSLQDLLLTPNQMCTFQVNDQSAGTLYASESNFRVDFSNNDKEKAPTTHLVSDLVNVFLWFEEKNLGIRVSWPIELDNSELDLIAARILNLGIKVDSECSPWVVDSSKFELPDHIDFKDFGKKAPGSITEDESTPEKKAQCAECSNLDPQAASKCYQDLDCR